MADDARQPLLDPPRDATRQSSKSVPGIGAQIFILCAARGVETGIYNMVFPIIPDLVTRTGVREEDLGYYCGAIESSFAVAQCIAALFWGRISDRRGRKPVLCSCLLGTAIAMTLSGFATKVWQMILIRAILGIFAASELTIRVMIGESSDNSPQAYAYLAVAGNLAQTITPVLIGASYQISRDRSTYPAFFPCATMGGVALLASLTVLWCVDETSPGKREDAKGGPVPSYDEVLRSPGVIPAFVISVLSFFMLLSIIALGPTYMYTSVANGGWSFSSAQIAGVSGWIALWATCWTGLGFSRFLECFGTRKALIYASWPAPSLFAWWIVSNSALRGGHPAVFWTLLPFLPPLQPFVFATTHIVLQVTLNKLAPLNGISPMNSLSWAFIGAQRAVIPALLNSAFALTVQKQLLGGHLLWVLLTIVAVIYCIYVRIHAGGLEERLKELSD